MSRARTSQPLAIDGGTPVRETLLEFSPPIIGRPEIDAVVATLESGWLTSGPRVVELEERFAEYAGAAHAIATSSCTDALHLALRVAGVGAGDEVVTSSFTWPATVNAILHTGATPRFADIDAETLNVDPAYVEAAITPRTRAVVPVHFAGGPCDMDAIQAAVKGRQIAIIEDAAHAVEATVRGRKIGAIGDLTCFSLYATKSLAGGEGGIVTTDSAPMAKRLRLLRAHGITRDPWRRAQTRTLGHYDVVEPGWKANLADLQAAAALPKVARIDELRAHRADLVERYDAGLAPLHGHHADRPARVRRPRPPPVRRPNRSGGRRRRPRRLRRRAHGREHRDGAALPARAPAHLVPREPRSRAAARDGACRRGGAVAAAGRGPL